MKVMYLMALILSICLPLSAAEPLPASMSCGPARDPGHATCEMKAYWGVASTLRWQVYLEDRLVADGQGLKFEPVIDEQWRTVRAVVPASGGKAVFAVDIRLNPGTKKAEFLSNSAHLATFEPYATAPAEHIANAKPP